MKEMKREERKGILCPEETQDFVESKERA